MDKPESLEEFYKRKFDWMPEHVQSDIGHFNVFRLEPFVGESARPIPYKRRDFYKIMLVTGRAKVHYADHEVVVEKHALSFSNPQIPYKWEHKEKIQGGFFCIFNHHFFHQYGNLRQYEVFKPNGTHIFELSEKQALQVGEVFQRMFEEISSDYIHKYDVLRNQVFELLHFAMKLQPSSRFHQQPVNASTRIATMFLELLERQFPIDDDHPHISLRVPADFADQLNVHINHLNRSVKEITQKTTSQIIASRILQEATILLRQSRWNVAEIAYALGFKEAPHFNNFFKKHTGTSPSKFRSE